MDTNTVQVISEFGTKLDSYASVIANKAGIAVDHFYPMFIQQTQFDGAFGLIQTVFTITVFLLAARCFSKNLPQKDSYDCDVEPTNSQFAKLVISAVFGVLFGMMSLFNLGESKDNICKIYNPEYYVVQHLIQTLK